jgi:transient receptor potential cation channel subfamily M member 3
VPIYIKKLDFKTREELQQMPQTEEEHLENQYLDYEEKEKSIADAEVKINQNLILEETKTRLEKSHLNSIFLIQNFSSLSQP